MQGQQNIKVNKYSLALLISTLVLMSGCLESEGSDELIGTPDSPANNAPVITGSPGTAVNIGDMYTFRPSASDADGDGLTFSVENQPVWATFDPASGELSGQPTLANVGVYSNILISVSDGAASDALPRFAISVDQIGTLSTTLNWTAPTQNEDGSTLTDLAGFKIYWGTTPGQYTHSTTLDNPSVTTYLVENLSAGTYEFVATSFNAAGIESRYSSPATKVLQ